MLLYTANNNFDMIGMNVDDNYTMNIKAWLLPGLWDGKDPLSAVDAVMEEFASMLEKPIEDILGVAVDVGLDVAGEVYDDLKNVVSTAIDTGSIVEGALVPLTEGLEKIMSALGTYTDGDYRSDDLKASWRFPVPESLTDSVRHSYEADTFSPLEKMSAKLPYMATKLFADESKQRMIDNIIQFNVQQAKRNNFTIDNNLINIYKNTDQREFIFNVPLIPQSYEHFKQILRGLAILKILMTGKKITQNLFIKQQCVFTISFQNEYFSRYMLLNDDVELNLETLEIDVSGNPFMTFDGSINSGGGVPKLIQIIMTFRERRPMRDDRT